VAAVALPIAIAYAQLAGLSAVVGIYSSILPLLAYALFGSSRQLMVNPDAAACAIVASTVAPLAAGNADRYLELAIALTLITGILCITGGLIGFGVIANFLSRPILYRLSKRIALSIIVGQLGKLLGFAVASGGFFRTLAEVVARLGQTQSCDCGGRHFTISSTACHQNGLFRAYRHR
jgi:MFS superfamily sulfate permease-like transporter